MPSATPVPIATQTLIPVQSSPVPPPSATPSATPTRLPQVTELAPLASATALVPLLTPLHTRDLSQAQVLDLMNDLAQNLGLPSAEIRWVSLERASRYSLRGCEAFQAAAGADALRVRLLAGNSVYAYVLQTDQWWRCPATKAVDAILLAVDPVAAELFALAQLRIARERDLPQRRVQLVSAEAFTWQDSSLGCPQDGQNYSPANITGYRFVVQGGEVTYAFHSDSERLYPCPLGRERLPSTPQVTATPSPAAN